MKLQNEVWENVQAEPWWMFLFTGASLMWLLLYCLCPVPVVLTHSYHGVPLRGTSCSGWYTVWWASQTVGRVPPCRVHSGTAASHHSPHSTECTYHSSCLASHLKQKLWHNGENKSHKLMFYSKTWSFSTAIIKASNYMLSWASSIHPLILRTHFPKIQLN